MEDEAEDKADIKSNNPYLTDIFECENIEID